MYHLRKEPYESTIDEIKKTDGVIIPERKYMTDDRAIYKHNQFNRFYRRSFEGDKVKVFGTTMKLYQVKSLKRILKLRKSMFSYCNEWFDVYDENGIVEISEVDWENKMTKDIDRFGV